jgi:hypothetical protein
MSINIVLKESFIELIKKDERLKLELAEANDRVKISTIDRWLRENDPMLTTAMNLEILKNHFEVLESAELLEKVEIEQDAN